jgi:hypothetical protein
MQKVRVSAGGTESSNVIYAQGRKNKMVKTQEAPRKLLRTLRLYEPLDLKAVGELSDARILELVDEGVKLDDCAKSIGARLGSIKDALKAEAARRKLKADAKGHIFMEGNFGNRAELSHVVYTDIDPKTFFRWLKKRGKPEAIWDYVKTKIGAAETAFGACDASGNEFGTKRTEKYNKCSFKPGTEPPD